MSAPDPVAALARRLEAVRDRVVSAGGDLARVRVVAVTKGFGAPAVREALACGVVDLGENYADELVEKVSAVRGASGAGPRWHFLGSVQRNKVARLAPHVTLWQSVDRVEEGAAIARPAPGAAVLVEVDTAGRAGRGGVTPGEVPSLVSALGELALDVRGLMTVAPPLDAGTAAVDRAFAELAELVARLGLAEASMGMSDDLELAVRRGATIVRVGRALFGPRRVPRPVPQ
ncbi:MAG: YggS family pyridoxal phosphate-dependent enzyme [Actinomycetota bacterium]|nr:YggS family pyridoxal phosphate-dependent enzyme [Actinomycetota bacterium]